MQDGAELALALAHHRDDVEAALAGYEQALFPSGVEAAADGERLYRLMFGDDAPHGLVHAFVDPDDHP